MKDLNHPEISRKEAISRIAAGGILISSGSILTLTDCSGSEALLDRKLRFKNFDEALVELNKISSAKKVRVDGNWNLFQILTHCAQSVEFSLSGFPKDRPAFFRKTVGKIVFSLFKARGYMSHGLNEPIPDAPEIPSSGSEEEAMKRLVKSIQDFNSFQGEYKHHFVYDDLTKEDYLMAHAMHLANHLSAIEYES